jgi:hypothetical protein
VWKKEAKRPRGAPEAKHRADFWVDHNAFINDIEHFVVFSHFEGVVARGGVQSQMLPAAAILKTT